MNINISTRFVLSFLLRNEFIRPTIWDRGSGNLEGMGAEIGGFSTGVLGLLSDGFGTLGL